MEQNDNIRTAEVFLKASDGHRQRALMLHQNEWQIAIALWTGIGATTLAAMVNADKLFPMPTGGTVLLAAFYVVIGISYLVGFCRSNYKSLTEERARYRYFQNRALKLVGGESADCVLEDGREPGVGERAAEDFGGSRTWRFKVWSTYLVQTASLSVISLLNWRASGDLGSVVFTLALWVIVGMFALGAMLGYLPQGRREAHAPPTV